MATRMKADAAQAAKQKRGTSPSADAIHGRRTTGTVGGSGSGSSSGKSSSTTASGDRVPNYLRPTMSSRTDTAKAGKKEPVATNKPSPALSRRRSFDRPPPTSQMQRVLSTGPRERSLTVKSASVSSASETSTTTRPEYLKSKTMPKSLASSRSGVGSGSGSGSGSSLAKTVKKSSIPAPTSKPESGGDTGINKSIAVPAEPEPPQVTVDVPQVTVDEEKPASPSPAKENYNKFEDEAVEYSVVIEDNHSDNEKEEVVSLIKEGEEEEEEEKEDDHEVAAPVVPTARESSEDNKVVEMEEETHHDNNDIDHKVEEIHDDREDNKDERSNEGEAEAEGEGEVDVEAEIESSKLPEPEEEEEEVIEAVQKSYDAPVAAAAADTDADETPGSVEKEILAMEGSGDTSEVDAMSMSHCTSEQSAEEDRTGQEVDSTALPRVAVKPVLKAQKSNVGRKDSPMYNDVIEETASKLLEKRKNKVRALVGAFETVISLQDDA